MVLAGGRRQFVFRIRTMGGNIVIEAQDIKEAKWKLRKRYPDCEIVEEHEKS